MVMLGCLMLQRRGGSICLSLTVLVHSLVHQCGRSPAAQQIDTPDLCLWRPLICLLRLTIIPPLPTCADRWRLRWGVLDLHCMVGWRGTGLDQIRPCSLCAYVFQGAGKSYR